MILFNDIITTKIPIIKNNKKEKNRQTIVLLTVFPLFSDRLDTKFDVFETLLKSLEKNNVSLEEGDVLVFC